MNLQINNEANRIALSGDIPNILRRLKRHGIKIISQSVLYRIAGGDRSEGANFLDKTRVLLAAMSKPNGGYLHNSLAIPTEAEKRRMSFGEYIEKLWSFTGDLLNFGQAKKWNDFRLTSFQFAEFLRTVEVVG